MCGRWQMSIFSGLEDIVEQNHPLAPKDAIPAEIELSDDDLDMVAGGAASIVSR